MVLPFPIKNVFRILRYGAHVLANQHRPNWALGTGVVGLLKHIGVEPRTFVDVGAHDSEIAKWVLAGVLDAGHPALRHGVLEEPTI